MRTSQTSRQFPRPEHKTAEQQGCHKQGKDSSNGSILWTLSRFSQLLLKRKFFAFETLDNSFAFKRKIKSSRGINYGKESVFNHGSNLFSLLQLDGVKYFTTFLRS